MRRERLVAEADAGQQQPEVLLPHEHARVGGEARQELDQSARAPRAAHRHAGGGGLQHHALHPFGREAGVVHEEALHAHAAHGVADEDHVPQVEELDHTADVLAEVLDRVAALSQL